MAEPDAMMRGTLGDFFSISREKGSEGLPTLSVTMYDGLVRRDSIDRKTDSELEDGAHLRVRPGDIAYNMMRMWQGASGLATEDGIVSPAYVVVRPKKTIDPLFASYWFKSERMIYLFWAYSYGLTNDRLRLYAKDFTQIPVELPALPEQRWIAEVLADFDSAIEATDALSKAKQDRKRALIDATFPQLPQSRGYRKVTFKRLGEFVRGVTYNPNGDICAEGTGVGICGATQIQDGRLLSEGKLVWVDPRVVAEKQRLQSGDFAIATSNGSKALVGKAAEIKAVDRPLAVGGFSALLRPKGGMERQLARHLFQSSRYKRFLHIQLSGSSIGNLYTSALEEAEFDVPLAKLEPSLCLLDELGEEIDLLTDKSNTLRQQQRGLMQKLLSGDAKQRRMTMEEVAA
ncbi:restriction endonuclease subunit S [Aurantiacibacter poecillastricola]|uniref:restriction endonuclease subunit S n=1 Tax=Aurantiacibacter poecillastricola TaxID=3064385 RepID=UPI00273D21D9|nr:restriction endonuclease subunit S [Aurantiacibacter sp. 219JJ12-13]MDP5260599.1 restriction endonuclease subunit S [Aurantiacibacter sp. 219JJ12-13]